MKKLLISALLPRGLRFKTRGFNSSYLSAYGPVMTLLFPSPSQRYRQLVMNPNMLLWLHDAAGKVDHEGFAARLVKISNYYSPPLHIRGEYFCIILGFKVQFNGKYTPLSRNWMHYTSNYVDGKREINWANSQWCPYPYWAHECSIVLEKVPSEGS